MKRAWVSGAVGAGPQHASDDRASERAGSTALGRKIGETGRGGAALGMPVATAMADWPRASSAPGGAIAADVGVRGGVGADAIETNDKSSATGGPLDGADCAGKTGVVGLGH